MEISDQEHDAATRTLADRLTHGDLDEALRRHVPQPLLGGSEAGSLPGTKVEKAALLVEARRSELLNNRELRRALVRGDPAAAAALTDDPTADSVPLADLAIKAWHPGKQRARRFCAAIGLPPVFAGHPREGTPPDLEEIQPETDLPPLTEFQEDVVEQVLEVLEDNTGDRGMISLPTGAGKTRTAMTAIARFQDRYPNTLIVWLATTAEICEQAVQSFLQIRKAHPPRSPVQVQRFWGTHSLDPKLERGLIVASVQKMYSQLQGVDLPNYVLGKVGAVFFDEGHHAVARTYDLSIQWLIDGSDAPTVPVIGLTATPGRGSDPESRASRKLVKQFGANLLVPRLEGWDDPVNKLQAEGVLSKARAVRLRTNRDFDLSEKMAEHWDEFHEFGSDFLRKVGRDNERNAIILDNIRKFGSDKPGLIYACSVEHAEHLAFLLRRQGHPTVAISAETRSAIRQQAIEQFQAGEIQFLTNFGVLTTGFDAPAVELIVLARPVSSQVLYEQMLGRGLRGPKFGGTEECTILDFEDSIAMHGRPLAYRRFLSLWGQSAGDNT